MKIDSSTHAMSIQQKRRHLPIMLASVGIAFSLSSCANVPLQRGGSLSSYQDLKKGSGKLTKTEIRIDAPVVAAAKTIRIVPTHVSSVAAGRALRENDMRITANAIDRAMCVALSDRFQVVGMDQPADLTVNASIVNFVPTNAVAAGVSTAVSLGSNAVLPVSIPRIPIGLGGLAVEAEALGVDGKQKAAIIWSKGANSLTTKARMSDVGDAYSLAGSFGSDFGKMLSKAQDPSKGMGSLPSGQRLWFAMGGKSKYAACEKFGRAPGLVGAVGGEIGLPPDWTDKGGQAPRKL